MQNSWKKEEKARKFSQNLVEKLFFSLYPNADHGHKPKNDPNLECFTPFCTYNFNGVNFYSKIGTLRHSLGGAAPE